MSTCATDSALCKGPPYAVGPYAMSRLMQSRCISLNMQETLVSIRDSSLSLYLMQFMQNILFRLILETRKKRCIRRIRCIRRTP